MNSIPADIINLVEKYINGNASVKEVEILNNWYRTFNDEEITVTNAEKLTETLLQQRIKNKIDNSINNIDRQKSSKLFYLRRVAAAVVILVALSLGVKYLYNPKPVSKKEALAKTNIQKLENKIVPGGNKATLTLADGSIIVLDSALNGNLTQQGNIQIKKLQNGLLVYTLNGKTISETDAAFYNTISTPNGGEYQVTLADGTKVWLNAASSIRFPVLFNNNERKVFITGEAYFEVAPKYAANKENIPFLVSVNNSSTVKVLGTHFNINAYADEPFVKTSLLEGSVKVYTTDENNAKLLYPGQQAAYASDGKINVTNNADMEEVLAWKNGRFQFKSANIETMLRQIARWYNVEVVYKGQSNLHFTGQLNRNESVFKIFEKLQLTGEVKFEVEGRKIIVTP